MSRLSIVMVAAALAAGCAQRGPGPMYMWESFPTHQYHAQQRDGTTEAQITAMQAQAEKARGANAKLPPGFLAHLGMLQLSVGNAEEASNLWNAEKVAFPESAPYMDQLLKKLAAPQKTANNGSPA